MGVRTPRGASRILALLVESGMIYILIGVSSALVYKHSLSQLFFLQVTTLASMIGFLGTSLSDISSVICRLGTQLSVGHNF
jgi:hypothetical protein